MSGKRFVPTSTILRRMDRKDLRFQAEARRKAAAVRVTHFCEYDRLRPGRPAIALCGAWVDANDLSPAPTCPACSTDLARTAADVFGQE